MRSASQANDGRPIRAALILLFLASGGCVPPAQRLSAEYRLRRAERRSNSVSRALQRIRRQRCDYEAAALLARDGDTRGRSFLGLAALDAASGDYEEARANLVKALAAGGSASIQRAALLRLGDLLERRLGQREEAEAVYRQLSNEFPGTLEAKLADLRLKGIDQ